MAWASPDRDRLASPGGIGVASGFASHRPGVRGAALEAWLLPGAALAEALRQSGLSTAVDEANALMAARPERTGQALSRLRTAITSPTPRVRMPEPGRSPAVALALAPDGSAA